MGTHKPYRPWPGKLLRLQVLLILLLVAALAWLPVLLPHALQQQGVVLQWQDARLSFHGLQLGQLTLKQDGQHLQADNIQLNWRWQRNPLQQLQIGQLSIQASLPESQDSSTADAGNISSLFRWLPRQITIRQLLANISGLAQIEGSIQLQADASTPAWRPGQVELDLVLHQFDPSWMASIPVELQPSSLRLRTLTHPDNSASPETLQVLSVDLHSQGQSQIQLSGIITLLQRDGWQAQLDQARLHLELPQLRRGGLQIQQLQTQLYIAAEANLDGFQLQLTQSASLNVKQLDLDTDTRLQRLTGTLTDLSIAGSLLEPSSIQFQGSYHLGVGQLQHPLLRTQTWSVTGSLSGGLPELKANAAISNTDGLQLDSDWSVQDGNLAGHIESQDIFFRAGNPLQKTLSDWPTLVEFNNGRLGGQASIRLPNAAPLQFSGRITGNGLGGIINRSELAKLDFTAFFRLDHGNQLRLDIPKLTVGELDPGVPIQQLTLLESSYSGFLDRLLEGTATWQSIRGQLLGGEFTLHANRIRLDTDNRLQLQLSGIQLQEALAQYPAEGLNGQAIIDGTLPLLVSAQGVFVEQGQLQARQPGTLQFQSEQIRAMGRSNPGMQLVAEALEDFHFNVLSSKLDYEPSGKLLFNIRLEGKNPAVENGRPIHLNLNLEEDLPALLASIQLGNHVSETIQERIRQRLQNR